MGNIQTYESIYDYEKAINKVVSDFIIKVDHYNDKKFNVLIYDYNKEENVIFYGTGYLFVNHGSKIFSEYYDVLLCWIYVLDERQYLFKIVNPIRSKIKFVRLDDEIL